MRLHDPFAGRLAGDLEIGKRNRERRDNGLLEGASQWGKGRKMRNEHNRNHQLTISHLLAEQPSCGPWPGVHGSPSSTSRHISTARFWNMAGIAKAWVVVKRLRRARGRMGVVMCIVADVDWGGGGSGWVLVKECGLLKERVWEIPGKYG